MSEIVEGLSVVAKVAAPAGLAIGVFLFVARGVLAQKIYPQLTKAEGAKLILHLAYMAWSIAIVAIIAWAVVAIVVGDPKPVPPEPIPRPQPGPVPPEPAPSVPKPPFLPEGKSGWVLAGRFEKSGAPTSEVVVKIRRPTETVKGFFSEYKNGAAIEVASPTRVRLVNFVRHKWTTDPLVSPMTKSSLDDGDETGVTLPVGAQMTIRGTASYLDGTIRVLWLRVAEQPQ